MGKAHRIKKRFRKAVEQDPWGALLKNQRTWIDLGYGIFINVGVRFDGSRYMGYYRQEYKGLMKSLIEQQELLDWFSRPHVPKLHMPG